MDSEKKRLCYNCFKEYGGDSYICPFCGFDYEKNREAYPLALPAGTILSGQYILGRVLGQGGFGITYVAQDYHLKIRVAIKEYFPETLVTRREQTFQVMPYSKGREEDFRYGIQKFLEEARTLAEFVGNPNVVGVRSYFEEFGTAYFVMEYVEGQDFKNYIKNHGGRVSWQEAWGIMEPVMKALVEVHKKGIIHRDVTPDNILISLDGTPKITDFGAARMSLGEKSKSFDVILKAGYAPKEQYYSRGKQGPYTDVYSVAACFYAATCGYLPPEAMERADQDSLVPLSARGVALPDGVEWAILKGLAVNPEDRFQTMYEFLEAIRNTLKAGTGELDEKKEDSASTEMKTTDYQANTWNQGNGMGQDDQWIRPEPAPQEAIWKPKPAPQAADRSISGSAGESIAASQGRVKKSNEKILFLTVISTVMVAIGTAAFLSEIFRSNNAEETDTAYTYAVEETTKANEERIEYDDGSVYVGEVKDGLREGYGTYTAFNGEVYTGEWHEDRQNGQGTWTFYYGGKYVGEFEDGIPEGEGVYTTTQGEEIQGEWSEAEMEIPWYEGYDIAEKYQDMVKLYYSGMTCDGVPNGKGIFLLDFESVGGGYEDALYQGGYEGEFVDGGFGGYGRYVWFDDDGTAADTKEGIFDWEIGQKWLDEDGNVQWIYSGGMLDGIETGIGMLVSADETRISFGEFKEAGADGMLLYIGLYGGIIGNTGVYAGEYSDGKLTGYGTWTALDDSESYVGYYTEGAWDGYGIYTNHITGNTLDGEWDDGTFQG